MLFNQKKAQLKQRAIFYIQDKKTAAKWVDLAELRADEKRLSLSNWGPVLKELGWDVDRPPKTHVEYYPDRFCLEVEVPLSLVVYNGDKENYCRTIASFLFPHQAISELPVQTLDAVNPKVDEVIYKPK